MNVKDVYNAIDAAAPFSLAMDFDNPGAGSSGIRTSR